MTPSNHSTPSPLILALLGAVLGAATLALSTPRSGREIRAALRTLGNRFRIPETGDRDDEEIVALFI